MTKAGNIWGYLQILDFSEDMHMFYHYTQLAFLCNCCYLKPHPNCYSSRYYQIPGFPEDTDQTRPYQTRPDQIGPDQTRPVSYKDLSLPFLKVRSINFVFTNFILVHLQVSGISGDFVSFLCHTWSLTGVCQVVWCQGGFSQPWPMLEVDPMVWTHTLSGPAASATLM